MNENHKMEIEELLNDLIDGQATDRQETEFKRLAKHNPAILEEFEAMRRQKQLLNALPVESAPDALAEEIRSALERKLILGDVSEDKQTIAGVSHLYMRRILTTAAMLLLPLGLLSFVVYDIMIKDSDGPGAYVSATDMLAKDNQDNLAAATPSPGGKLPFDGILTFETDRQTAVSNYIEKMIFEQGLNSFPTRTADAVTHQITASPGQIKGLLKSLDKVWPHCQRSVLSIVDGSASRTIEIPFVQPEQIAMLAGEDSREMLNHLAERYATANENKRTLLAQKETPELKDLAPDASPRLAVPTLTGRSDLPEQTVVSPQPAVRLRIHIKRPME